MPDTNGAEVKKPDQVTLRIDDREVRSPAGYNIIQAAREHGIEIPHYCYHDHLSVAANCRICLVQVKGIPKLVVACGTKVAEGMEVFTQNDEVVKAREGVMEFLLINHPLDCPECDQAGECRLQNYSYEYGRYGGRFEEQKVVKSKTTMGPHVKYWGSRCIVCTRCVRFTDEISGTQELGVIYRGDRSEIATFPGKVLDNPLSLNTVDVCPVGALVSSEFLFQSRVWNLKSKNSICPDCSIGCNSRVDVDKRNEIKRIVPRVNEAVNKSWMCDEGRLSFPYVHKNRMHHPYVDGSRALWAKARDAAAARLRTGKVVFGVSAWNTSEAMEGVKRLVDGLPGARVFGYSAPAREDQVFPGFTISGDRNPNSAGLKEILGIGEAAASLDSEASQNDPIDTLYLLHNVPYVAAGEALQKVLGRARSVVLMDFTDGELLRFGNVEVALPTLTHFESAGSYINRQGMRQEFHPAMDPVTMGRSMEDLIRGLEKQLQPVKAL